MVGSSWLSPQDNLAQGTKVLTYTLCLDACVYLTLFRIPLPAPAASSSVLNLTILAFCQDAGQLSHLLDVSLLSKVCYLSLSLSVVLFIRSLTTYPHKPLHHAAVVITTGGRNELGDAGGSNGWMGQTNTGDCCSCPM